jgi:hypothetical protein
VAIFLLVAPWPAPVVETAYSRGVYRYGQAFLTTVSNITPWTWLDVLAAAVTGLALWRLVCLVRDARTDGWLAAGAQLLRRLVRAAGVILTVFCLFWGLNYRRAPLAASLVAAQVSAPADAVSVDDLRALTLDAARLAARTRVLSRREPLSYEAIAAELPGPFNRALARLGRPPLSVPGRPKYTIFTPFFTRAGVTGMVDPFALESLVHPDLLPFERPAVLAHEWAHLAGYADEAEASAIGWSACMLGDATLVNSAAMFLLTEAGGALPPPVWRSVLAETDAGVIDDLRALNERLRDIQPEVRAASFKVYDSYLKANSVPDGVLSYSRVLQIVRLPIFRDQLNGLRFDQTARHGGPGGPDPRP